MPAPEPLPGRLLGDPAFANACANREIGILFQHAKRAGIGPAQIARRTGLTTSRVTEIMTGGRAVSSMDVIERIADGLRIPGRMLGLAVFGMSNGSHSGNGCESRVALFGELVGGPAEQDRQ
ncbi:helix-turn-helix domain-containing protein [Kitasatospora sp. NPDC001574]